jgi:hypothetical protein
MEVGLLGLQKRYEQVHRAQDSLSMCLRYWVKVTILTTLVSRYCRAQRYFVCGAQALEFKS